MRKIISLICVLSMLLSSFVFTANAAASTDEGVVSVKENFNSAAAGSVPDVFFTKEAGDAAVSVVEIPDKNNKSLYMRSGISSSTHIQLDVNNPDKNGLTLSFRMMIPKAQNFAMPTVIDSKGNMHNLISVKGTELYALEDKCANLVPGVWHYVEIKLSFDKMNFRVSLDGVDVTRKLAFNFVDIQNLRFELTDIEGEVYLDDISVGKTASGEGSAREYYPSEIFLTDDQMSEVEDIQMNALVMHKGTARATHNGVLFEMTATPIEENKVMYAPLRSVGETLGALVSWNNDAGCAELTMSGNKAVITPGSDSVSINGEEHTLSQKVLSRNGSTYIAAADIPLLFNTEVYVNDWLIYVGGDASYLQEAEDIVYDEVVNIVRYPRPTGEEMAARLTERFPNNTHPRLYATQADFERVKTLVNTESFASKCFAYLKAQAESMLDAPLPEYATDAGGIRLTTDARDVISARVETMAFMWKITGDKKYADRAWKDIEHLCNTYPDWNPPHILDIGYIGHAVAIGYDWMYDYLDDTQKATIRQALLEKAVNVGLSVYRGNHEATTRTFWAADEFNWNPTVNAAMLAASLVICDEDSATTVPTLSYVLRSLEFHLGEFDPDGGWQEGPGYGSGTIYSDVKIMSLLDTALGTDYNISEVTNVIGGAYYQLYMLGPEGLFNYGDSNQNSYAPYYYEFYLAKKLNDKSLGYHRKADIEARYFACDPVELIWYDPAFVGDEIEALELDKYFRKSEAAVLRSNWEDDGMFVGFLAGDNEASHSHYDTGNFVFDWNGTRWASDYGMNNLTYTTESGNSVYSYRAEGHNTLVMDETPYKEKAADGEWLPLAEYDFEDLEVGGQPDLQLNESAGVGTMEAGSVHAVKSPVEGNTKNMSLRIHCPNTVTGTQAIAQYNFGKPYPQNGAEISFKILFEEMNYMYPLPYIGDEDRNTFYFVKFDTDGKMRATSGSSSVNIGAYELNTWYDFKFIVDFKAQTFDIYLNGELVAENLAFKVYTKNLMYLRWRQGGSRTGLFQIDDVKINVHPDDASSVEGSLRAYDQVKKSKAYIDRYESKPRGAYAISDITRAYSKWAESAVRGVMLTENRGAFVVRDEVKLKAKSDVYWFSHQLKEINAEILPDGKSAILTDKHGNRMWVGIISDNKENLELWDCTPLPGSPNPASQAASLQKYHKLAIKFEGVEEVNVSVAFVPLLTNNNTPAVIPADSPLSEWSIPDGEIPSIDTITLDGKEIEGFKPSKTVYNIALRDDEKLPVVEAWADGVKLSVTQPPQAPGAATFKYYANGVEASFTVNFTVRNVVRSYIQGYPITEDGIATSSIQQEDNPPKATIDGVDTTRWAAMGKGEWIIFDFEEMRTFSQLDVGWYLGERRKYDFEIQLSADGANWTSVFKGTNSGTTGEAETYKFAPQDARYIKIIGNGSNENLWNNIAEVR